MSLNPKLILMFLFFLSCFIASPAHAVLSKYTYTYDISQLEWQILNWTSAYRGSLTPGDPFTLERIEYNRKTAKVIVYLSGMLDLSSEDNLNKSLGGVTRLFAQRFPGFDSKTDLIIYYKLLPLTGQDAVYKEYSAGEFNDRQSAPDTGSSDTRY